MRHLYACLCIFSLLCFGCEDGPDDPGNSEKPALKINTQEKLVANAAGSFDIYVTSNSSWTIESKNSW